jgi:hypothetical protein
MISPFCAEVNKQMNTSVPFFLKACIQPIRSLLGPVFEIQQETLLFLSWWPPLQSSSHAWIKSLHISPLASWLLTQQLYWHAKVRLCHFSDDNLSVVFYLTFNFILGPNWPPGPSESWPLFAPDLTASHCSPCHYTLLPWSASCVALRSQPLFPSRARIDFKLSYSSSDPLNWDFPALTPFSSLKFWFMVCLPDQNLSSGDFSTQPWLFLELLQLVLSTK